MEVRGRKRAGAILLISVLLMGAIPRTFAEVHAAEPDAMKFATKEQLLDSFDTDDTTGKPAKRILFGQNGSGAGQEWHIAGKDPAVGNTDGLVLFAASPLLTAQKFSNTIDEKDYDAPAGTGYDPPGVVKVKANHYGASDLRKELQRLEGDAAYFSTDEQSLMRDTVVYTHEYKDNNIYSTKDKLYAANVDVGSSDPAYITVGTNTSDNLNGGLRVKLDPAYCITDLFWLRARGEADENARVVLRGAYPSFREVTQELAVVPAFQLDLSSVLFASAVPAAVSEGEVSVNDGSPFVLRYMAGSEKIGKADLQDGSRSVAVSEVAGTGAYLVVQNDAGAYVKAVNGDAVIEAKDITIGGSTLSSFSGCKVWLEKTNSGRITKAVMAESRTPVYSISVSDGAVLAFDARNEGYEEGERPTEQSVTVTNDGNSAVVLKQPVSTSGNYEIGTLNKTSLAPTEEATFTVRPKKGLKAGNYSEIIEIKTEQNASASVEASFTVNGELIVSVTPGNVEIPEGGTVTLSAAAAGGSGNYTYTWYEGNSGVSFAGTQSVDVSPAATVTYKVVVTDTIEDKEATATVTVVPKNYAAEFAGSGALGRLCTGYTDVPAWAIHIKNVGNVEITNLQASLDGGNKDAFILDTSGALGSVPVGAETAFTVKAAAGLAAGTYKTQIEATADNGIKETMELMFTVADHDYKPIVTPPTCTEKGYTTYTCSICNHSYTADETDPTGHDFDGAWSSNDKEHWKACRNTGCQETSERAAHTDENQDGICEVCGHNMRADQKNQAASDPPVGTAGAKGGPKTGDNNRPGMWCGLCVLSGITSVGLYIKGKSKRKSARFSGTC